MSEGVALRGASDGVRARATVTPLSVTLLRTRRHVDLCRTATAICRF